MDTLRHASVFDPAAVKGLIAVVGVGAVGSALALQLGKLGLTERLVLFDGDRVESHNIANQCLFGPEDIGEPKVEAAHLTLHGLTGATVMARHRVHLMHRHQLAGVTHLFVCVDSMRAREAIFDECVEGNYALTYFSDGRMNARNATCIAFAPSVARRNGYRERLYPDTDVPPDLGTCGNRLSIGATATTLACQMTWALIRHTAGSPAWEEISFGIDDLLVHYKGWLSDEHNWRRAV